MRTFLYTLARLLGDVAAVVHGTIAQRLIRKAAYRTAGSFVSRLFK